MTTSSKTRAHHTLLHPLEDKSPPKRVFKAGQPRKKPFYDTKRKKLVIPTERCGNQPLGLPASGIPAAGERTLSIERKYEGLSEIPTDIEEQNKLGKLLLESVLAGEVQDTGMFAIELGLNPYKFHHIADKNEYFQDCLDAARYAIGQRGLQEALDRKKDGGVFMKVYGLLNRDYRDMLEDLKAKEASKVATQAVVYVDRVPDSPLVPHLKVSMPDNGGNDE